MKEVDYEKNEFYDENYVEYQDVEEVEEVVEMTEDEYLNELDQKSNPLDLCSVMFLNEVKETEKQ